MASALRELMVASRNLLLADSTLMALLSNDNKRIMNKIPQKPTYPYIRIGSWSEEKFNVFARDGKDIRGYYHIYSQNESDLETLQIIEALTDVLIECSLTMSSWNLVYYQFEDTELYEEDLGDSRKAIVSFNIKVQEKVS